MLNDGDIMNGFVDSVDNKCIAFVQQESNITD